MISGCKNPNYRFTQRNACHFCPPDRVNVILSSPSWDTTGRGCQGRWGQPAYGQPEVGGGVGAQDPRVTGWGLGTSIRASRGHHFPPSSITAGTYLNGPIPSFIEAWALRRFGP